MDNLEQSRPNYRKCNLPKLFSGRNKKTNISIISTAIETVIKTFQQTKDPGPDMATRELYDALKELTRALLKLSKQQMRRISKLIL